MPSRAVLPLLALLALQLGCEKNPVHEEHPLNPQWTLLGLENSTIAAIAVDPTDRNIIYAGSISDFSASTVGGLFKSIDGGAVWDTLIKEGRIRDIDIHPNKHQTIYVTGAFAARNLGSIIKSVDGGQSWVRADSLPLAEIYESPGVLTIDPLHPETLYVGAGSNFGGGIYKSTNGGQTWSAKGDIILQNGVTAIAIDPNNTDIIYAGTAFNGALCKSSDGGDSWERLDFPEVGIVHDLLVNPKISEIIYAGAWRYGFYISMDGGDSWLQKNLGLEDKVSVLKIGLLSNKDLILAAGGAAYMWSEDDEEWAMVDTVTFSEGIKTVVAYGHDQVLVGARGLYLISFR